MLFTCRYCVAQLDVKCAAELTLYLTGESSEFAPGALYDTQRDSYYVLFHKKILVPVVGVMQAMAEAECRATC